MISSKHGELLAAHVKSTNRMLAGDFTYKGKVNTRLVDGHLRGWLRRVAHLHAMGLMADRYVVSTWTGYRRTVGHEEQSSCKRSSSLVPSHARRKEEEPTSCSW